MTRRRSTWLWGVAATTGVLLGAIGCGEDEPRAPAGPPPPAPGVPPAKEPAPPAPFASPVPLPRAADLELPKADVRLLLTGQELGIFKPCGCTSPQVGGLERRAALWERLRGGAAAFGAVSLGQAAGVFEDPLQGALKSDLHAAALSALGYDGVLLGVSELTQAGGPQPFVASSERPRPPLNVKIKESGPLAGLAAIDPVLRFEKGGLPVRAVSVIDPNADDLVRFGVADAVIPPEAALEALVKEPGLLVVAVHALRESVTAVVRAAEAKADVVVVVDMPGDTAYSRPVEAHVPKAPLLVRFDDRSKETGVLDLVRAGDRWSVSYRAVTLDPSLEEGTSRLRDDVETLFGAYRRRVREEGLLEKFPSFPDEGPSYVGSDACASCHAAIHASWKETPHAHALETLAKKGYAWDPECVRCHVVGWQRTDRGWYRWASGFRTPDATPALAGVGCEACHGPGSDHVKDPKKYLWNPYGAPGARNWKDLGRRGCETCHDVDNSPTFTERYEAHYRPKVDHRDVPKERRTNEPK
jgi:hypothetical protein